MSTWAIVGWVLIGTILGIVTTYGWLRSRSQADRREAVNRIPDMLAATSDPLSPAHDLATILVANCDEYKHNATWWSFAYFTSVLGSAVLSALAALILKAKPEFWSVEYTNLAAGFSTVAALLVTLSTVGSFGRKWQANRVAEVAVQNLAYELLSQRHGADIKGLLERLMAINTAYNQAVVSADQARPRDIAPPHPIQPMQNSANKSLQNSPDPDTPPVPPTDPELSSGPPTPKREEPVSNG